MTAPGAQGNGGDEAPVDATGHSNAPAILVEGLHKSYGDVRAVDGIDLRVEVGECFGILGPNGAGKTTALEMIEGLRQPDGGSITVLGESPWPRNPRLLPRIGVQLQSAAFIDKLTAMEQLLVFTGIYDMPATRAADLLELVGLAGAGDTRADRLSGGQQQRLSTACALVGDPELVFLDEPSAGLDPSARRQLWDVVERIKGDGRTVVLTTHYMEEAEVLCDRVAIMDRGRVLAVDTPPGLVRGLNAPTRVMLPPSALGQSEARRIAGVTDVEVEVGALILITHEPAAVLSALARANLLDGLQIRSATLEDAFLDLTGRPLAEVEP
ncbi:MAG: ABC transporter ATP-binding protein [Microthrixaceae bacterium]